MTKTMPPEVMLGAEILENLHLTAQACVANVEVRETVPANAAYVRSEPSATVDGKNLTWRLGNLEAGEVREIRVWLKASQEGTLASCASVSADPRTCAATKVVNPAIQLAKSAPAEVVICDPIPVTLTVRNSGSSALTAVRVNDSLPDGLSSDGKRAVAFEVGNLAPGESKEYKFNAVASRPGEFNNQAKVTSAQGVTAEAAATTVVRQPVLTVACSSPGQGYMGRPFEVSFTVGNRGDTAAADTVLEVPVPEGLKAESAANGGQIASGKITWNLGSLAVQASRKVSATFVAANAANFQFAPAAKGSCAKLVASSCATRIVGVPAILLEKADHPDPVSIGESTTYTVKITNQGSADDNNVKMVVTIAPELVPVSATGGGVISGQTVTFPTVTRLTAKDAVSYQIIAKGVKPGDGRTRFELTSDMLRSPVIAEESTHVY